MSGQPTPEGPDFTRGVDLAEIPPDGPLAGRVGDEHVLLSRFGGELSAVGGLCTHYGAALSAGLNDGATIRCPLHHACFDLRTGRTLRGPALDDLDRWEVEVKGGRAFVKAKAGPAKPNSRDVDHRRFVIIGGGAAGVACANQLRKLGFDGEVVMLSAEQDAPCDRPNLSKDYLAGTAPEEWMPLRSGDWYREHSIELRLGVEAQSIDVGRRAVICDGGEAVPFDRLLIATGAEPNRLRGPAFEQANMFALRTLDDARAIIERSKPGSEAVIIGSSFIGLEAASALRKRGVEVSVVSNELVPFEAPLGPKVGRFLQELHERHGVRFHMGTAPEAYEGKELRLAGGAALKADYVLAGIGVRPRLRLAQAAGLRCDNGVVVDGFLETSVPGIYAAGDIAAFPDPLSGELTRIEHWALAQRQGEVAAANMLGLGRKFDAVPFFWTEQHGVALRYVGHARRWDRTEIDGDLEAGSARIRYFDGGVHRATVTIGRDVESLEDEFAFEQALVRPEAEMAGREVAEEVRA